MAQQYPPQYQPYPPSSPPPAAYQPTGPKSNPLALWGMILGIVGWAVAILTFIANLLIGVAAIATMGLASICGCIAAPLYCLVPLCWLVGVILSPIGLSQVNKDPASYSPNSKMLAIVGLILNGLGILLTLCAIIAAFALGLSPLLMVPFLTTPTP